MPVTLTVPDNYGYVVLSTCLWSLGLVPIILGGPVMKARKKYNVPYPNLYATPGYHKEADAFNRIQRGHQNMYETLTPFAIMNLIGGLKYPLACTFYGICYGVGSILFLYGYSDLSLDVKDARYRKGGGIKYIGILGAMGSAVAVGGQLCGWWN